MVEVIRNEKKGDIVKGCEKTSDIDTTTHT